MPGSRPSLRWPSKLPSAYLDYSVDLSRLVAAGAQLTSVSVACAPSGPAELDLAAIAVDGAVVTVWIGGGQPDRCYRVRALATTSDGRRTELVIELPVACELAGQQPGPFQSAAWGAPIVWRAGLRLDFHNPLPVGLAAAA